MLCAFVTKAKNCNSLNKKKNSSFSGAKKSYQVKGCGYRANMLNCSPAGNLQGSLSALKIRKEKRAL